MSTSLRGLLVPALTPFRADLSVDPAAFVDHCRHLLADGATGLAPFGTTSEANSLSLDERMTLLDALIDAGIPGSQLMPGTGTCNIPETVRLMRHAVGHGCAGVLALPPFYYKNVSDDGLFAAFSAQIEQVASPDLRVYLYHIPPVSQTPIGLGLIERLVAAWPGTIAGVKDSSGDWENIHALIETFPQLDVFPGSELFLLDGLRAGGAGCITATGNVNTAAIRGVVDHWQDADAEERQMAISAYRRALQDYQPIPAMKAMIARRTGNADWATVRPPLVPAADEAVAALDAALAALAAGPATPARQPEPAA